MGSRDDEIARMAAVLGSLNYTSAPDLVALIGPQTMIAQGLYDAGLRISDDAERAQTVVLTRLASEVVALLTTSGREPPPLNDYGLMSTLYYYAGPNARTLSDRETATRVSRLGEVVHELRAALAVLPVDRVGVEPDVEPK